MTQKQPAIFITILRKSLAQRRIIFPSAYKRAAKYGQIDPANEILRTETLNRLQSKQFPFILVSYPMH